MVSHIGLEWRVTQVLLGLEPPRDAATVLQVPAVKPLSAG